VLVLDDQEDVCLAIGGLLEVLGARVVVAANGLEGLEQLERQRPDMILCDLAMPMMDGIEFATRVRRNPRFRRVLLVAVTGREHHRDFLATLAAGFDAHVVKPVTPEALTSLARRLSGHTATDAQPGA
jgi:CheY-like chemotaxis protein